MLSAFPNKNELMMSCALVASTEKLAAKAGSDGVMKWTSIFPRNQVNNIINKALFFMMPHHCINLKNGSFLKQKTNDILPHKEQKAHILLQ